MKDKKIAPIWMVPAALVLWGLFGFLAYMAGLMARAALGS